MSRNNVLSSTVFLGNSTSKNYESIQQSSKTLYVLVCYQHDADLKQALEKVYLIFLPWIFIVSRLTSNIQVSMSKAFSGQKNLWYAFRSSACDDIVWNNPSIRLTIKSQLFIVNTCPNEITTILEVYQIAHHLPVQYEQMGVWTHGEGLSLVQSTIWERRKNLTGVTISTTSQTVSNKLFH